MWPASEPSTAIVPAPCDGDPRDPGRAGRARAIVVGIVGYLRLSLEPAVNQQLPYLASAGMALVFLSVLGGSLLVAEQLRADERRVEELESAIRALADAVAPAIEAPARRTGLGRPGAIAEQPRPE